MAFEIKTSIKIKATPEAVWSVFSKFNELKNWNTFLIKVEGDLKVGNKIKIRVGDMNFKPKVLIFNPNSEFKWKGKLLLPYVFDGTHQFLFIDNKDGTTTFEQNELFRGILVPLMRKKLNTEIKANFEKMNLDLKNYIESYRI